MFTQAPLDGANSRKRKNTFLKNRFSADVGESVEWSYENVLVSIFEAHTIHEIS